MLKIAISAGVTAFVVIAGMLEFAVQNGGIAAVPVTAFAAAFLIAVLVGCVLGLMLELKDVVERRCAAGHPVNPILRMYFGSQIRSLLLWFVTIIVLVIFAPALAVPFL